MPMIIPPMTLIKTTSRPANGIAADEFRGTVHGAEEAGFVFQGFAPPPCFLLVDQSGRQIGVDRLLLAGHGVQVEPGGDFGDAAGALGDDHEIHDDQDREHDDADDAKLPPMTKPPNASMTWPAAAVLSWPRARMSRVEAQD
jgi:hypothetical protein